jgi:hypothetical protein
MRLSALLLVDSSVGNWCFLSAGSRVRPFRAGELIGDPGAVTAGDESLPDELVLGLLKDSYELVVDGLPGDCPTADVENPSPHELKDLLLQGGPVAVFGEEDVRGERRTRAAVVELEHHLIRLARKVIEQQTPESVLLSRERLDRSIRSVSPMHR